VPGNEIAVNKGFEGTTPVFTHRAYSAAAVLDHTAMTAEVAFDLVALKRFPEIGFHDSSIVGVTPLTRSPVCTLMKIDR
jgi:hypothetical protein